MICTCVITYKGPKRMKAIGDKPRAANKFFQKNLFAAIAQLVEHDLAKVGVASSSLVCRSTI